MTDTERQTINACILAIAEISLLQEQLQEHFKDLAEILYAKRQADKSPAPALIRIK